MKPTLWLLCKIAFIALSILAFTPIVIPQGDINPVLFGLPRTLWMGIVISLLFIILTVLGALFIDTTKNDETV